MKRQRWEYVLGAYLAVQSFAYSFSSYATLGEPVSSVEDDRKSMVAVRKNVSNHRRYTVHELSSDSTQVKEYCTPAGLVFGITWKGVTPPDLSQLLGSYAMDYDDALKQSAKIAGRRVRSIKGNRVIVESWGHMRNLQGRAYAPALIPQGVNLEDIK